MRSKFIVAVASLFLILNNLQAQDEIRLAFYNILNFPQAPPSNRLEILSTIVEDIQPDIFMIAELESENSGADILSQSLQAVNTNFESAPYFNNTSSGADLQQLLYYDSSKFQLLQTSIIPTTIRDINRYQLQTITSDPEIIEVFVSHLKASQGDANEQLRFEMVLEFTEFIDTLDPDSFVVFAGDLNLYSSEEPAYQELLDNTNNITLLDPIESPGEWNNNVNFEDIHTQSTRLSSDEFDDFGAGGGLDSRFDFILLSENFFQPDATITYIDASYKSYGNNGNCYNNRLDASNCDGEYDSTLRSLLYQMSDHLPVLTDLSIASDFLNITDHTIITKPWSLEKTVIKDNLNVVITDSKIRPFEICVYDQAGRILRTLQTNADHTIDVSALAEGLYFITGKNAEWPALKFIKTN